MQSAPHPSNEVARLAALAQYELQQGTNTIELGGVVDLAAKLFDVPIVLVSIVECDRQRFHAKIGLDVCETHRDVSFCAHALSLERDEILLVPDAALDPRFADNPMVTGAPGIRFYAGVPLRSPDGYVLGTLCIIDTRPRAVPTISERAHLQSLAAIVVDKLEMRRLAVASEAGRSRFENISATSPDGIICADHIGNITFWNAAAERLFGYPAGAVLGSSIAMIVPQALRGAHEAGLRRMAQGAKPKLVGSTVELPAVRQDGSEFQIELSLSMWREDGKASFGATIRDITSRRANEAHLHKLAHFDGLTDLPNRTMLLARMTAQIASGAPAALVLIDLDGFKHVNDTLGHTTGDAVLRQLATRIEGCVGATATVARLGGDEFAVLMPTSADNDDSIADTADCLMTAIAEPASFESDHLHVSASIGVALFPDDANNATDLLSAADLAMYQAKAEGRGCRRFFTPGLRDVALRRRAFEGEIRRALSNGEFALFYQPQVRLHDGALLGVEALLRWHHPRLGLLTPDAFLPSIEAGLLAAEVGRWTLETACVDALPLRRLEPNLVMGVNLFEAQFRSGRLATDVIDVLTRTTLPPAALELEITENIILRHDETMLEPLRRLRALGVGIAFDDFGTGFASLSLLKRFPLTRIKIDRSFVRDICNDRADAAIVTALVFLAGALEVEVIAEGVETNAQCDLLRTCGCPSVQGYLFARPMPFDELVRWIDRPLVLMAG